jgi:hypothetical protein
MNVRNSKKETQTKILSRISGQLITGSLRRSTDALYSSLFSGRRQSLFGFIHFSTQLDIPLSQTVQ